MKRNTLMTIIGILLVIPCVVAFANTQISHPQADLVSKDQSTQAKLTTPEELSMMDHEALVYAVSGNAQIMKNSSDKWKSLVQGTRIQEGDQIKTGKDSFVEIYYDSFLLNHVRIDAESMASFETIEPTQVSILDGKLFNILDGLPKGSGYEVRTPTAVASIRGTNFVIGVDAVNKTDRTDVTWGKVQVYPFQKDGKTLSKDHSFSVNKAETLNLNYAPDKKAQLENSKVQALSEESVQALDKTMEDSRIRLIVSEGGGYAFMAKIRQWLQLRKNEEKMGLIVSALQKHGEGRLLTQGFQKTVEDADEPSQLSSQNVIHKAIMISSSIVGSEADEKAQNALMGASKAQLGGSDEE